VKLVNLVRRGKVAKLAPPQKAPEVVAPMPAPLSPGEPLLARPQSWVGIAISVLIVGFVVGVARRTPGREVGRCLNRIANACP